jgi:hypothetical protein
MSSADKKNNQSLSDDLLAAISRLKGRDIKRADDAEAISVSEVFPIAAAEEAKDKAIEEYEKTKLKAEGKAKKKKDNKAKICPPSFGGGGEGSLLD